MALIWKTCYNILDIISKVLSNKNIEMQQKIRAYTCIRLEKNNYKITCL